MKRLILHHQLSCLHLQKIVSKFRRNEWSYFTMNTNVSNSNTSSEKKKRKTKN